jgi:hypothetical protein
VLQSLYGDLFECCYVDVFGSRVIAVGWMPQQSHAITRNNKLIQELICAFCWFYSLHYNSTLVTQSASITARSGIPLHKFINLLQYFADRAS